MLNKQIAGTLGIADKTFKVHRAGVMEKMREGSVAELVRLADRRRRDMRRWVPRRSRKDSGMRRQSRAVIALGLLAIGLAACEGKGRTKSGEKIDRATDQGKVIGKGLLEKAGKNADDAVKDLKR